MEPDLPHVEQLRAFTWGLLAPAAVVTAVVAVDTDPWWALPAIFAVLGTVLLALWWSFERSTPGSWLDAVERVAVAPGTERTSAARRSGLLRSFGALGIVGVLTVVAWPVTGRTSVGPLGALVGVGFGAAFDTWRARRWEAEHGLRLYVRLQARRLALTRAHQLERLVAAPPSARREPSSEAPAVTG